MKFLDAAKPRRFYRKPCFLLHFTDDRRGDILSLFNMTARKIPAVPYRAIHLVLHKHIALSVAYHAHEPVHIKIASKIIANVRSPKYSTSSLS